MRLFLALHPAASNRRGLELLQHWPQPGCNPAPATAAATAARQIAMG